MDGNKTEHLKEFVGVLERYVSAIGVRTFAELKDWETERTDPILNAFAKYSTKPIINLESAMHHPCQAMADMMTIRERFGRKKRKFYLPGHGIRNLCRWPYQTASLSLLLSSATIVRIAHPKGYELDDELIENIKSQAILNGGSVEFTTEPHQAFDGAEVVYAKSWGSKSFYGAVEKEISYRAEFRKDWIVDEKNMSRTHNSVFMHCLPVRRNVVVTDGVIDSKNSLVIDEAENRLHIQKAIMTSLIK